MDPYLIFVAACTLAVLFVVSAITALVATVRVVILDGETESAIWSRLRQAYVRASAGRPTYEGTPPDWLTIDSPRVQTVAVGDFLDWSDVMSEERRREIAKRVGEIRIWAVQ